MQNPAKKRGDALDQNKDVLSDVIILAEKKSSVLRRRLLRLSTVNDLSDSYLVVRQPRGNYRVPMPENLIGVQS